MSLIEHCVWCWSISFVSTNVTVTYPFLFISIFSIQVRDHALKIADNLPTSAVNREYFLQNVDTALADGGGNGPGGALGNSTTAVYLFPLAGGYQVN